MLLQAAIQPKDIIIEVRDRRYKRTNPLRKITSRPDSGYARFAVVIVLYFRFLKDF